MDEIEFATTVRYEVFLRTLYYLKQNRKTAEKETFDSMIELIDYQKIPYSIVKKAKELSNKMRTDNRGMMTRRILTNLVEYYKEKQNEI